MLRAMSGSSRGSVVVLGFVCAELLLGCAYGEVRQVVRAQFASELDCPEVQIQRRNAWYGYDTGNQFKVSGCGVMRTYTCNDPDGRVSYDEPACTWVEGDADAPKIAAPRPEDEALDEASPDESAPLEPAAEEPAESDPFEESAEEPEAAAEPEPEAETPAPAKATVKKGGSKVSGGIKIGR